MTLRTVTCCLALLTCCFALLVLPGCRESLVNEIKPDEISSPPLTDAAPTEPEPTGAHRDETRTTPSSNAASTQDFPSNGPAVDLDSGSTSALPTVEPSPPTREEITQRQRDVIRQNLKRVIEISVNAGCLDYDPSSYTFKCPEIVDVDKLNGDLKEVFEALAHYRSLDSIDDLDIDLSIVIHVQGDADGLHWKSRRAPLRLWQRFEELKEIYRNTRNSWPTRDEPNEVIACVRGMELLHAAEPSLRPFREEVNSVTNIRAKSDTRLKCVVHDKVGDEFRGASYQLVVTIKGRPEYAAAFTGKDS